MRTHCFSGFLSFLGVATFFVILWGLVVDIAASVAEATIVLHSKGLKDAWHASLKPDEWLWSRSSHERHYEKHSATFMDHHFDSNHTLCIATYLS